MRRSTRRWCSRCVGARLEAGEHNPSFDALARLSSALGIEFHIAVTPEGVAI
jgi:hypothetical protein